MPSKAFLEITNICNLDCSFCHKTIRDARMMSVEEFTYAARQIRPFAEYLYFHLMGEPLLHPQLSDFLRIAADMGFRVILTTNGTLLSERERDILSDTPPYKISISLHSFEANSNSGSLDEYLECHPEAEVDYIHGEESTKALANQENAVGFIFDGMQKSELFTGFNCRSG